MIARQPAILKLQNAAACLLVDPFGGAITEFRLTGSEVNPLSFAFSKGQMPVNNKNGAPYQGHFACIGRWGEPSAGEKNAGIPNHGEPANIIWSAEQESSTVLSMQTIAKKEGLQVDRTITMDKLEGVYHVSETITNINVLGRLYNIVQHPTLAAPFLDKNTIIDCNASIGFDQAHYKEMPSNIIYWPIAKDRENKEIDLRNSPGLYNAVFSFVVKLEAEYGWVTAFSPVHNILFGYLWKRNDYPWIHLWQHYEDGDIRYRGIEFGTAGIHQPFDEILKTATYFSGERTASFIDAGEAITKKYFSFIYHVKSLFGGTEDISIVNNEIIITPKQGDTIRLKIALET